LSNEARIFPSLAAKGGRQARGKIIDLSKIYFQAPAYWENFLFFGTGNFPKAPWKLISSSTAKKLRRFK